MKATSAAGNAESGFTLPRTLITLAVLALSAASLACAAAVNAKAAGKARAAAEAEIVYRSAAAEVLP
ncbi:MAG: hypothetical protein LBN92_00860 [Treponema sp.]|jgi:type II secretory pathway pseudopilin PulG|nr:hypothetical protein [Treponema sp.]